MVICGIAWTLRRRGGATVHKKTRGTSTSPRRRRGRCSTVSSVSEDQPPSKVPAAARGYLIFASDSRCCVCKEPGVHVHHIDGNHRDHDHENLAFLCFSCHDKASKVGGLSSKLPVITVRMYRDHWHAAVLARREAERRGPLVPQKEGEVDWRGLLLDMLAVMEVRKVSFLTPEGWDDDEARTHRVRSLFPYTFGYGVDVRLEVVDAVHELAGPWSWRTPRELAEAMGHILYDTLPIGEQDGASPLTLPQRKLFTRGAQVAVNIAYHAGRYMEDLCAVQAGCKVLEKILRRAFLSGDVEGVESMKTWFTNAMGDSFADGRDWMQFTIANALRPAGSPELEPPQELQDRLWKCREIPSPVLRSRDTEKA
jgi:hypothetical protein